ncbi:MAG: hypothetical protein HGA45_23995, partial [Chloroflexales bacterium]|nr:hypothetical protein [Chloroflexales bacterium]
MSPNRCLARRMRVPLAHLSARQLARSALNLFSLILILLGASPLALLGPAATAYAQTTGTLTVRVYNDTNRNGVDNAEPAIVGQFVTVYSADDRVVNQLFTNDSGVATFSLLPFGLYRVEVTPPANTVISVPGPAAAGQVRPNPGLVFRVALAAPSVNFGVGLRDVSGGPDPLAPSGYRSLDTRIWDDLDADGIQDAGEPGLTGLTVQLFDGATPVVTATEVPDLAGATGGRYIFEETAPVTGTYTLRVVSGVPAGYSLTRQNALVNTLDQRDSDGDLTKLPLFEATILPSSRGFNEDTVDIGFARGAISGFIFRDINRNGDYNQSQGDQRLNGIEVELLDASGTTVLTTTTTRAEFGNNAEVGVYSFTGLVTGTYTVRVPGSEFLSGKPLAGAANSPTDADSDDRALPDGIVSTVTGVSIPVSLDFTSVANGSNRVVTSTFGFYKGSVGDFVWFDLNRDRLQAGEADLGQNGIRVYVDVDSDGIRDTTEISTFTNLDFGGTINGSYLFNDLPLGQSYRIVLDADNFLPGATLDGIGVSNALSATNALSQTYYYTTSAVLTAVTPDDPSVDFGLVRSDVGNFVFEDANGNGLFDPVESPIPGVGVELRRASNNNVITTTTTSATGTYTIPNVPAVGYYAVFDLASAGPSFASYVASPKLITTTVDPAETTPGDFTDVITPALSATRWRTEVFTPALGIVNRGVDAGFYQLTTVAGRAFFDTNNNSLDEAAPAEPGMRGVEVRLRRADDASLVLTTTTAISDTGVYSFTSVAPGAYQVDFVNPISGTFELITGTTDVTATGQLNSDVETILPAGDVGRTATVNVNTGTPVDNLDAGFRGRGEVQGRVFLDNDGSDTQSTGDSSLPGATAALTVTASLPNLVVTYTPVVTPTTTNANDPNYSFAFLPFGTGVTYTLNITPPPTTPLTRTYLSSVANVGGNEAVDSDGPTQVITETGVSLDFDQGFYQEALVNARVFEEIETDAANINNQYDGVNDLGIADVTVGLETITGTLVLSDTTDATGLITFTVKPGSYQLNIDQADSDLGTRVPSPGWADPITVTNDPLTSNEDSLTNNAGANSFGYYSPARVSGEVFFDRNEDDLKASEPGVGGVEVLLSGPSGPLTATTDLAGAYTVTGLLPGLYTATFTNPDLLNFAFITGGDSDVISASNVITSATLADSIVVAYGLPSLANDAGLVGRSLVEGAGFVDLNADGVQNDGSPQPLLPGVTVTLLLDVNLPGRLTTQITREVVTPLSGIYRFTGLPGDPNTSTLSETAVFSMTFTPPSAAKPWNLTTPEVGAEENDSDNELIAQVLPRGSLSAAIVDRDQGYYQNATITGLVFEERTSPVDNDYVSGDLGLGGVDVSLETLTGTLVLSGTTDPTGVVTYTVRPGSYRLNIDQADVPAALIPSPGWADPITVTNNPLTSNEDSLADATPGANSFGYYRPATVTGTVFFDRDLDSLKAGEPGVGGVEVALSNGTGVVSVTTTLATGAYTFTNLVSDTYTLTFTNPDTLNFAFFAGGDSDVTTGGVASGVVVNYATSVGENDAGLVGRSALGGRTFADRNANGSSEGDTDPGLDGVTVTLTLDVRIPGVLTTQVTRTVVTPSPTQATGVYTFTGLPGAGGALGGTSAYSLSFTAPAATPPWQLTTAEAATVPEAGNSDGDLLGQALARSADEERDQGYYQNATITGLVFEERTSPVDNDYVSGDLGLGGVDVSLETLTGTLVLSGTTDPTGVVTFTARPGVDYRLNIDQADVSPPLTASPGFTDPLTVTGNPLLSGQSSLADATPGANSFGYYRPATVTGTVFFDRDLDSLKAGEPGVGGVEVALSNGTGVVSVTTTLATGAYTFTNLVSDTYTLTFT